MRKVAAHAATRRAAKMITVVGSAAAILAAVALPAMAQPASAGQARPSYDIRQILSGQSLHHWYTKAGSSKRHWERLTLPDDITTAGGYLFTGFQNGVGPQGQASTDGNRDSTIVEFTRAGQVVRQWDVRGKCDGLTADPATGAVIATVNEDANSSLYRIDPWSGRVGHYYYNKPLPHHGGTDAISFYRGQMLISASAPGTTGAAAPNPAYPAVYSVSLDPYNHVAYIHALFYDESTATAVNGPHAWKRVKLGLTDPDSNEVVPWSAPRFASDFMLTSQGDKEQIYLRGARHLSVLSLSQSVDDTAWATSWHGTFFASDTSGDTVDAVSGRFWPGTAFVAVTPCDANGAPATCPGPGYPANYLGQLNMYTGQITRVWTHGARLEPQGMIFVAS
ncbi:MAG: hypothetical protein ABSA53_11685 [Streptosporangiaceae bacterium]